MAQIQLQNVTKIYPGRAKAAVDSINLHVPDREFAVLVGPSGSGKSTILRLIAGLEKPTAGNITLGDRLVNHVPPKDRDLAMVFQNFALYPHMSVYKNMALGLLLRRRRPGLTPAQIQQRVQDAAQALSIADCLDRKPRSLSGGQRQRVALGRAVVRNPQAFLFDEPLSSLDALLRAELRAEIKKLHQRLHATILHVTHDQEEAMTLGDRIIVMDQGIIHQSAAPLDVYHQPANRFVAGFIGTPQMNFINGTIVPHPDGPRFVFANHPIKLPPPFQNLLRNRINQPLVLGIRPSALTPISPSRAASHPIDVKVNLIQPFGDLMDISVTVNEPSQSIPLTCRVETRQVGKPAPGDIIRLYMDLESVHLFEPGDHGVNITLTQETSHAAA